MYSWWSLIEVEYFILVKNLLSDFIQHSYFVLFKIILDFDLRFEIRVYFRY